MQKESVVKTQKNYGYVVADERRTYVVMPRFGGYVVKLFADVKYKKVNRGDPLVRVYSPEVLQAKEEYLNTYRYTQKRHNKVMLHSAKEKLLLLGITQKEIKAMIKRGKAEAYTTVTAPASGYIFVKGVEKGSAFSAKSTLFKIVNIDRVWIEAKIYQKEIAALNKYVDFRVRSEDAQQEYQAKRLMLYPALDPKQATATLRLGVDNKEHKLFPGMYMNVTASGSARPYLTLPRSAVIRKNSRWYVFGTGEFEGEYEPKEVHVKPINGDRYAITEGVGAGDEVVSNALFMMDSDAQINGLY